ncbi:MAG: flagellar type III secretion system pore protein FliP [Chitinispirillales bacterium]|jgi:flagellar biosynthetic protein FliP|nr:flagellar type III secretion system pore protein FliP [Chitinispirillales bacterium]
MKKFLPVILFLASAVSAQVLPSLTLSLNQTANPEDVAVSLQIVFLITILALAPSILVMMTSFVRIIIVFSFIRRAIGLQTMPPDQILVGLALFLTFYIMTPTFTQINDTALQPYLSKQISWQQGIENAGIPMKKFMLRQVYEKDVALLMRIAGKTPPKTAMEIGFDVLIPSFMISELKTAFIFGFIIYLPFLVVDMVVASVLLSMGMMMLPPTTISLPFKVILFVLIDGWNLTVKQLVGSFF